MDNSEINKYDQKSQHVTQEHGLPIELSCDTYAGIVHVEWDTQSPVTPIGQLIFFIQFLKSCDLFGSWVKDCPLTYRGPRGPAIVDVLGTLFLAVLSGYKRYAHITSIRHDRVNPPLLGMTKVLSEDSARRAFKKIDETSSKQWQQKHLEYCYNPLLKEQWVLDIDTTIKVLYGHQEGAEVGYNPRKPGRPAHIIHTYMMAETRMILDCEVMPGKQSSASYSLPWLIDFLEKNSKDKWPSLVRGDCAFGNDPFLKPLERLGVDYLFKLRQTKKVKKLSLMLEGSKWSNAGQGWEGVEAEIKLDGWEGKRRVIVLRRELKDNDKRKKKSKKTKQLYFPWITFPCIDEGEKYEYSVLVTSLKLEILTIAQLYRDRATCENNFDELKNQWGWAGFVTSDLKRSQIMSRIIAQVYNWWTLFVRWIDQDQHREVITSRPLMLYGVAREVRHAGQVKLKLTQMHGKGYKIKKHIQLINNFLHKIKMFAERLFSRSLIWRLILSEIFSPFLNGRILGEQAASDTEKIESNIEQNCRILPSIA